MTPVGVVSEKLQCILVKTKAGSLKIVKYDELMLHRDKNKLKIGDEVSWCGKSRNERGRGKILALGKSGKLCQTIIYYKMRKGKDITYETGKLFVSLCVIGTNEQCQVTKEVIEEFSPASKSICPPTESSSITSSTNSFSTSEPSSMPSSKFASTKSPSASSSNSSVSKSLSTEQTLSTSDASEKLDSLKCVRSLPDKDNDEISRKTTHSNLKSTTSFESVSASSISYVCATSTETNTTKKTSNDSQILCDTNSESALVIDEETNHTQPGESTINKSQISSLTKGKN